MNTLFRTGDYIKGVNNGYSITNQYMRCAIVLNGDIKKDYHVMMSIRVIDHDDERYIGEEFKVENDDNLFCLIDNALSSEDICSNEELIDFINNSVT